MSTTPSKLFTDRYELGLYDAIGERLIQADRAALAFAEYNVDFTRHIELWSKNYIFRDNNGVEFRTMIMGEICAPTFGTIISAKGNHYAGKPGTDFRPITDDTKVKDVLVLGVPTCATPLVGTLFYNQVAGLDLVRGAHEAEERELGQHPFVKEWIRNSTTLSSDPKDLITIHMEPKYGNPNKGTSSDTKRLSKRSLSDLNDTGASSSVSKKSTDLPKVEKGAFYDPALNADYGGPYFQHIHNKLVQLDVRDVHNELIAPWEFHRALRPGTLILANCTLHCFIMNDGGSERKAYQVNTHSIRVLAVSDTEVEEPVRPTIPNAGAAKASSSKAGTGVDDVFAKFTISFPSPSTTGTIASSSSIPSAPVLPVQSAHSSTMSAVLPSVARAASPDGVHEPAEKKAKRGKVEGKKPVRGPRDMEIDK